MVAKATSVSTETVAIPPMDIRTMQIRLIGDSPLICHAWSSKAKKQILEKNMKVAQTGKEPKDPQREYEESLYRMPDGNGYGFPAVAFKSAAVDACSHVSGVTKVEARGTLHIVGELVRIEGTPHPREDMVKLGGIGNVPDVRYRGEFSDWSVTLTIRYNSSVLSAAQIINLFNTGGFAIGVGEWRPQRDGSYGMFHVAAEGE